MKDLPRKHFAAIVADPPWHYKSYTALRSPNWQSRRDAAKHYATMSLEDLKVLPVKDLAAPSGCHLFLWVTGPCLPLGFELMQAWGFKYSSVAFTWVKLKRSHNPNQLRTLPTAAGDLHTGLGLTTRKNAEFCLLGRRGNARRLAKDVREIILAPVREHSRKPDEVYQRVERYCAGPYLSMFARESERPGWSYHGNEATHFNRVELRTEAPLPPQGVTAGAFP